MSSEFHQAELYTELPNELSVIPAGWKSNLLDLSLFNYEGQFGCFFSVTNKHTLSCFPRIILNRYLSSMSGHKFHDNVQSRLCFMVRKQNM